MKTWRINRYKQSCPSCKREIAVGEKVLDVHLATRTVLRCQDCGERIFEEKAPDVVEDPDPPPTSVPEGVRHQASMDFQADRGES